MNRARAVSATGPASGVSNADHQQAVPGGLTVTGDLQGWLFKIKVIAGGLQVTASTPSGSDPAVWVVTG